jgi:hypothetical protein
VSAGPPRGWRGPWANFFYGAPISKIFFRKLIFSGEQPPPPPLVTKKFSVSAILGVENFSGRVRCNCFPGTISFFYAKFWYLAQKNSHLVLCAEIFNTQKRLGPNKKFSGAPSTLGARGNLPPPLSVALGER